MLRGKRVSISFKIVVVGLVLGCSTFAKETMSADDGVLRSVYDLEARAVSVQNQFLPISPPSEDVYVHSDNGVLPVDWKKFPKEFTKLMYAEMDDNNYPIYRVSVYEDPLTRQTIFYGLYGEVYRLDPERGYDPYAWQTTYFQLEPGEVLDDWTQWLYDPAKIAAEFKLIPQVFHADYLVDQQAQAELEASMMPMMMSLQTPVTHLQLAIENTTNGTVVLEIGWPATFTNELEIFATTNLAGHVWQVVCTDIDTSSSTHFLWEDWAFTNTPNRSYIASKADVDTDGDGLADGREIYLYNSLTNAIDSDFDGLSDYAEVTAFFPTDPTDDDISAPAITIASPTNNVLVVP